MNPTDRPERAGSTTLPVAERVNRNPAILLNRNEVEEAFGLSRRWLELAAHRGDGPPMVKISRRMVRYRACDVEEWLADRTISGTPDPAA